MQEHDDEEELLRSVALQNAQSILMARRRAEQELIEAKQELERKTQELAHSLALMSATLESTTDGILSGDDAGRVTAFNQKFLDMWRIPRDRMEGKHLLEVNRQIAQELPDAESFLARHEQIQQGPEPESYDLLELADGRVFERYSKIQYVGERRVGRVWSFRDITARRRSEEALRDESQILELLNRTGSALASKLDLQAVLQTMTDAATQLSKAQFGAFFYNSPDQSGSDFFLSALSGVPREAFERLGKPRSTPLLAPTFCGKTVVRSDDVLQDPRYGQLGPHKGMPAGHLPVRSYLAVPVVNGSGEVIGGLMFGHAQIGMFNERTERLITGVAAQAAIAVDNARLYEAARKAAEEREVLLANEREARNEAERMSAIKDEFLATVSHELRTPLNAILGWTQVLQLGPKNMADMQRALDTIERNAKAQTQLIEDLLDMSRITTGKLRLDIQPLDPAAIIELSIEALRPAAEARNIVLKKRFPDTPALVAADSNRLQQIIWNLLSNAIKFTLPGGEVLIELECGSDSTDIRVYDTGIGIEGVFLPYVFERFRQADSSSTRRYGGLGLGLSIVKSLVELHGGSVQVDSEGKNCGACFTVSLPRARPTSAQSYAPDRSAAVAKMHPMPDLTGVKALVVDDEADVRELIERVLSDAKAHAICAASALEALELFGRERPDIVVSDIGMPELDGFELMRRIRALGSAAGGDLPAIALTAFTRAEDKNKAAEAGFSQYLPKPVHAADLLIQVAKLVRRSD